MKKSVACNFLFANAKPNCAKSDEFALVKSKGATRGGLRGLKPPLHFSQVKVEKEDKNF